MRVGDKYRTNPLSLVPGGKTVTVLYENGQELTYDKVKSPSKYIKNISERDQSNGAIVSVKVGGEVVWKSGSSLNPWDI